MTTKHTAGPWYWDSQSGAIYPGAAIGADGKRWYADTVAKDVHPRDLNLIAAAPDLLAVVEAMLENFDAPLGQSPRHDLGRLARAALKKAKGEE